MSYIENDLTQVSATSFELIVHQFVYYPQSLEASLAEWKAKLIIVEKECDTRQLELNNMTKENTRVKKPSAMEL